MVFAPDEEDMSQMEQHEFYSCFIIKIGAMCFFFAIKRANLGWIDPCFGKQ